MRKKYIVFWMPTIFHRELKSLKNEIINEEDSEGFIDLSDGDPSNPYYARFKISTTNDITIYSKVSTSDGVVKFDVLLELKKTQQRRNGFMQFSYNESNVPDNCIESFNYNLKTSIYDKIKEFFHVHECNTGKDAVFHPEITDYEINLAEDDNPALISFLKDFSTLFCASAEMVSFHNKQLDDLFTRYINIRPNITEITQTSDWIEFCKSHNKILEKVNWINELLENSLIEYTYCKTLLSSIYNKSFKHDDILDITTACFDIKNEHRRDTLNIRNSIRYIENIKFKTQNKQFALLHISNKDIRDITRGVQNITENVQGQNSLINRTLRGDKKWQIFGISLAIYSTFSTLLIGFKDRMCSLFFGFSLISLSIVLLFLVIYLFVFFDRSSNRE